MKDSKTFNIRGMHCASCAGIIEKTFKKTEGVESVEVNYGTEAAKIKFDESKTNPEALSKKIEDLGYSLIIPETHNLSAMSAHDMGMSESEHAEHLGLNQSKKEKLAELASMKSKIISVVPLAVIKIGRAHV